MTQEVVAKQEEIQKLTEEIQKLQVKARGLEDSMGMDGMQ